MLAGPSLHSSKRTATHVSHLRQGRPPSSPHLWWATVGVLALTVYGSLLPFDFVPRPIEQAVASFRQIQWYPPHELEARGDWIISSVQYSIIAFLGMGALAVDRGQRAGLFAAVAIWSACALLAIALEFSQIYFPPRTVSLNDILAEVAGAGLGIALWLSVGQIIIDWIRKFSDIQNLARSAARTLPLYLVFIAIVNLMPFDLVVGSEELISKWNAGKIQLLPFHGLWTVDAVLQIALGIACLVPVGFLQTIALGHQRLGPSGIPWRVMFVPPLIELARLFVYSRSFDVTHIISGWAGILLGCHLAGLMNRKLCSAATGIARYSQPLAYTWALQAAGLIWLLTILYFNWRPFDFTTDSQRFGTMAEGLPTYGIRHMTVAPFVDYYWGSKYNALDQFLKKGLSFMPLGVLLASGAKGLYRPGSLTKVVLIAVLIGVFVELGRYFLPGRIPSTTDVIIGTVGATFGYVVTRHVRALLWTEQSIFQWQDLPRAFRDGGPRDDARL